jgi:hypothetical protein
VRKDKTNHEHSSLVALEVGFPISAVILKSKLTQSPHLARLNVFSRKMPAPQSIKGISGYAYK